MRILLPDVLRAYAGHEEEVVVEGATVEAGLRALVVKHPALRRHLYADNGVLRGYVNVFLNEDDVRMLAERMSTSAQTEDTVMIIPSVAGG